VTPPKVSIPQEIFHISFPVIGGMDYGMQMYFLERKLVEEALVRAKGSRQLAAEMLGMGRTTLVEKMRKFDILFAPEFKRAKVGRRGKR
jgi:transcriptional regulator with AAA-type ATPase domain